jgi:Family of unknown function (DUF6765)
MQKDFHYFVIRILGEKAGFESREAQIIAYASQLVDDATEHKPIELPERHRISHPRLKGRIFDPVCTAHKGLQFLQDFKKRVQMKIYMSFHFLPPEIYSGQKKYNYVTKPGSNFAKLLIQNIKDGFDQNPDNRTYNLIALGIAIHTYADTWAHQNFSGRHNHENNVVRTKIWEDNKWEFLWKLKQWRNNVLPEIGHAKAYTYPDVPYKMWRYKKIKDKGTILRHNLDTYIKAAEDIYSVFLSITKKESKWNCFSGRLIDCLSYINSSRSKRNNNYKRNFPEIGFYYDKSEWRNKILRFDTSYKSDRINRPEPDYKWLQFHEAALRQREFVLKNIKPLVTIETIQENIKPFVAKLTEKATQNNSKL